MTLKVISKERDRGSGADPSLDRAGRKQGLGPLPSANLVLLTASRHPQEGGVSKQATAPSIWLWDLDPGCDLGIQGSTWNHWL